jgi:hypothetical protein
MFLQSLKIELCDRWHLHAVTGEFRLLISQFVGRAPVFMRTPQKMVTAM